MDYAAQAEAEFMAEQPYNAADEKQVKTARQQAARDRKEELDVIVAIMASPQGRKWMYMMLGICKIFGNPVGESELKTYFQLGEQNIGKKLLADVETVALDEYILMIREERDRRLAVKSATKN